MRAGRARTAVAREFVRVELLSRYGGNELEAVLREKYGEALDGECLRRGLLVVDEGLELAYPDEHAMLLERWEEDHPLSADEVWLRDAFAHADATLADALGLELPLSDADLARHAHEWGTLLSDWVRCHGRPGAVAL